jgi:hypothetical protein
VGVGGGREVNDFRCFFCVVCGCFRCREGGRAGLGGGGSGEGGGETVCGGLLHCLRLCSGLCSCLRRR